MHYKILSLSVALLFISSCKEQPEPKTKTIATEEIANANMKKLSGTWELVGFYNYKNDVVVDSFDSASEFRQLKIYTDTKVMWCKYKPADSSEWFGYGTYKYEDNTLTEVLDFGSAVMDEVIAEKKEFIFELQLQQERFQQIMLDDEGHRIYSENYIRIE